MSPSGAGDAPQARKVQAGHASSEQDARLTRLGELIAHSPHNLVATSERSHIAERHIAESLAVARAIRPDAGERWVDLGTGGGLPGLVLALEHPATEWFLVDAVRKKAEAVRTFAADLGLDNVRVIAERAETLAHDPLHRAAAGGVVARAVAPLRVLVELARGFVGDGGWLVAVKGPRWREELDAAESALARCRWANPEGARLRSTVRPTWLVTMRAVGSPPATVPRRAGVPQRRPF